MRRNSVQGDGFFNVSQYSDHEFDDEIASINSQQNTITMEMMMIFNTKY